MDPIIGGALTIVVSYFPSRRLVDDVSEREREEAFAGFQDWVRSQQFGAEIKHFPVRKLLRAGPGIHESRCECSDLIRTIGTWKWDALLHFIQSLSSVKLEMRGERHERGIL